MSGFDLFSILSLSVSIIAVAISYLDMRRRLRQEREVSQHMANLINTLREELELFRKQSRTNEDLKRQELLAKRGKQQWKQITDVAKGLGWLIKRFED